MTAEQNQPGLPLGLRIYFGLVLALLAAFVLTAPWRVAGLEISRLSPALWVACDLCGIALLLPPWRRPLVKLFRDGDIRFSGRRVLVAAAASALFLGRVVFSRYAALDINAWDTGLFFDGPIFETLAGKPLYCAFTGHSVLSRHGFYLLFAFVPLYAIEATPVWLLAAHAAAIAAAAAVSFLLFRRILRDDLAAAFVAAAFLLNSYTARIAQSGFQLQVFYLPALFLLLYAYTARRPSLLAAALLLSVTIKEDALLPLGGFAFAAAIFDRRWRPAAVALAAGFAAFFIGTRIVIPHFSGEASGRLWYSDYWASYGATPVTAAFGMLLHPARLLGDLARSGLPDLLEPLLLLPLAGYQWFLAALPALVVYSVSNNTQLSQFGISYSTPVLAFLFAAAAEGLGRATAFLSAGPSPSRLRLWRRVGALLVLVVCALDGSGYKLGRAHPARREVAALVASLGGRPVSVQGSLLVRAARLGHVDVLRPDRHVPAQEAVLLAPDTDPYPFSAQELAELIHSLSADSRYEKTATPGGLVLFTPRP